MTFAAEWIDVPTDFPTPGILALLDSPTEIRSLPVSRFTFTHRDADEKSFRRSAAQPHWGGIFVEPREKNS
jgi:hypothetical protein